MPIIAISGSYGGLNLGDEATLACMLDGLREAVPEVRLVVFSRNARHTAAHHQADRVVPVRELSRDEVVTELRGLNLLVLGGGGLLFDKEAQVYLREVQLAQELGVRTLAFALSAGPLEAPEVRCAVAATLNKMDGVSVREAPAKRLLEEVGVKHEIAVTGDPALLLTPRAFTEGMLAKEGINTNRRLVGVSVREPGPAAPDLAASRYHMLLAAAADFIADRLDADLVFVPMERGDIRHAHAVIAEMAHPERASVLKGTYDAREILGLMQHLDMAVGMRLHFLMFAAIARVPVVPLPYAGKVAGFLEDLGVPARTVGEEDAGRLLASIDSVWDSRHTLREMMNERLPLLQERARKSMQVVTSLLVGEAQSAPSAASRRPGLESEA